MYRTSENNESKTELLMQINKKFIPTDLKELKYIARADEISYFPKFPESEF